ncbi:polysaccharide pyruvyl transferase family protein [Bordetella genomosp. 4]|uniref:4Fe-4S ferredoxin-type domain-containing protein n=1 Tax=Bordetella genomosp. 4 TaxID=463044 RepID=A0A261U569_9BORD|nr:polysaccharide pyruvyl transferase family protein [Bordetella genomosp. 4]OZI56390.1 hypothetical protein CAL20_13220 [Bordetella genomosp. 4]
MFKEISQKIGSFLRSTKLDQYLVRKWVYRNISYVLDFVYQDVKFGFDVSPLSNGRFLLELVERRHKNVPILVSTANRKQILARSAPIDDVISLIGKTINQAIVEIDTFHSNNDSSGTSVSSRRRTVAPTAKSLRVGVLTLPLNANIGGNLQAYAMMEALRKLGHSPVFINSKRLPDDDESKQPPVGPADLSKPLLASSVKLGARLSNTSFTDKYLVPITVPFNSSELLARDIDRLGLDAIVAGSDQIWRPRYARSHLTSFFFGFLPEDSKIKRISYAASFGAPNWEFSEDQTREAARLIKYFDAVGVREDRGVELCSSYLGVEAKHVLDPTLLLARGDYAQVIAEAKQTSNVGQVVAYVLDVTDDKVAVVEELSKSLGLNAFSTTGDAFPVHKNGGEGAKGDKSVQQWLASLDNAAFVVTDSFHGVAFCILFNKPFIAYGNPSRGISRFTSLLKIVGLEDRLVIKSSDVDINKMLEPVNWNVVNERLANWRAESFGFLRKALSSSKEIRASPSPNGTSRSAVVTKINHVSTTPRSEAAHSNPICVPLNVLCSGCGVCVSESQGSLGMAWSKDGFLVPEQKSKVIPISAVKVCPFNPSPDKEVEDEDAIGELFFSSAKNVDAKAGRYENAYIGYSKEYRPTSSSGGIATYVFDQLLKRGEVDYLFIVRSDGGGGYKYQIFDKEDDIRSISKTRYFPVSLEELFTVLARKKGRVAVSGVACFIKAIRLKQHYYPELKDRIPFLIGIICGGLKSRNYTDFLAQSAGIKGPYTNPSYRVKDPNSSAKEYSFSAIDRNSLVHEVKMQRLGDMWGSGLFKARACDFCTDVLTELADISLGDAWLPEYKADGMGNSVVVTRSQLAEKIIQSGIESGELVLDAAPISSISRSQGGGFRHKRASLKFRIWQANNFSSIPVPVIRPRLLTNVPISEALIQIRRERARSKSLLYWNKTLNVRSFRKRMRSTLQDLKVATAARKNRDEDPLDIGQPIGRWVLRKIESGQINFHMLRTVLEIGRRRKADSKELQRTSTTEVK